MAAAPSRPFHRAIVLEPTRAELYDELGTVFVQQQKFADAAAHLKKQKRSLPMRFRRTCIWECCANNSSCPNRPSGVARRVADGPGQCASPLLFGAACCARKITGPGSLGISCRLQAQPEFPEALHDLGLLLQRSGDVEEAATVFRKLTTLQPDNADAHSNLGLTLVQIGDGKGSVKEFETALRLRPGDSGYLKNWAWPICRSPILMRPWNSQRSAQSDARRRHAAL